MLVERIEFGVRVECTCEAYEAVGWVELRLDPGRMRGNARILMRVSCPKRCVLSAFKA